MTHRVLAALVALALSAGMARAEDLAAGLARCAAISDSLQRLVCYDALAKGDAQKGKDAPASREAASQDDGDPCAPGLSPNERLRRLAGFGKVRQVGELQYEAGKHHVWFYSDNTLAACR